MDNSIPKPPSGDQPQSDEKPKDWRESLKHVLGLLKFREGQRCELTFLPPKDGKTPRGNGLQLHLLDIKDKGFESKPPLPEKDVDVYLGLNPIRRDRDFPAGKRPGDADVATQTALLIDLDPSDKTEESRALAKKLAEDIRAFLLKHLGVRTALVFSGRGYHLYLLHTPVEQDRGNVRARLLKGLAAFFDERRAKVDCKTANASRLARCPGTVNAKTGLRSMIVEEGDGGVVAFTDLDALVTKLETDPGEAPDMGSEADKILEGGRNDTIFLHGRKLRRGGKDKESIKSALGEMNKKRCSPPLSEKELATILRSVMKYAPGKAPRSKGTPLTPDTALKYTDLDNAYRFVTLNEHDLRYEPLRKMWYVWDGKRYAEDEKGEVTQRAKACVEAIVDEAEAASSGEEPEILRRARESANIARIRAMIELAKTDGRVVVTASDFDRDPMKLNCKNGILDLKTGKLLPHDRSYLMTKLAGCEFLEDAGCPTWEAFLNRIFNKDADMIAFQKRRFGYSLTALTTEQKWFLDHGLGANGKTTYEKQHQRVLGDYAVNMDSSTLVVRDRENGAARGDLARLRGARLAVASETSRGRRLDESLMKQLTGGDTITARHLYEKEVEFEVSAKIVLLTNHKPTITGTEHGIWRRVLLTPYAVTIPEKERDTELDRKLSEELPGILRWGLEGCLAWQKGGLRPPESVLEAIKEYRDESDVLGRFFEDWCLKPEESVKGRTSPTTLATAAELWCKENAVDFKGNNWLASLLKGRGLKQKHSGSERYWDQVALTSEAAKRVEAYLAAIKAAKDEEKSAKSGKATQEELPFEANPEPVAADKIVIDPEAPF